MQSELWRRNLYIIAFAEFIVLVGFSLFNPFLPLYMQELGGLGSDKAAFWAGIATGGSGLAMFISSPIWGIIADRWGRKPMLLRSQFGGAVVVSLFIVAPNIYFLVGFRMLQGVFTGTVAAASALIATMTPRNKLPYSMGILMGAVFAGQTIGPLLGGFMADNVGFEGTFILTSCLLSIGGLIVLILVKEDFQRPTRSQQISLTGLIRVAFSCNILPLLIVLAALSIGPQIASPVLPLIIGSLSRKGGAASASGEAYALLGVIAAFSSLVFARFQGLFSIRTILCLCCVGTGLLYIPPIFANSVIQLIIFIGITGLLNGGIITSSNSLVSLAVPLNQQGIAYGLSQSANSLGSGLGPLVGGVLAPVIGLRHIFGVTSGIFVLVGLLVLVVLRRPVKETNSPS
jgi:MFS transporter, DHA1 family, multidrug resistance protein